MDDSYTGTNTPHDGSNLHEWGATASGKWAISTLEEGVSDHAAMSVICHSERLILGPLRGAAIEYALISGMERTMRILQQL